MKKEIMLSTLMLATTVNYNAFAAAEASMNQSKQTEQKKLQSPVFSLYNPFTKEESKVYAVISLAKENHVLSDLSFGKITHYMSIQIYNIDGSEYQDFNKVESTDGGWFVELRGSSSSQKSYVLWTCSSTMNCGQESPGFFHLYFSESRPQEIYYSLILPISRVLDDGRAEYNQVRLSFDTNVNITK